MVHTTPPKVDQVDTSSAEAPMTQALVAQLGSKASDATPADNDPDPLIFTVVKSEIACWMSSLLQRSWYDSRNLHYPV
jgi:hypothetical protein